MELAFEAYRLNRLDGIGFVFCETDPFCGIDLDDCVVDGKLVPGAAAIVARFGSYTEVSPSGRGVKLFIKGIKPEHAKARSKNVPDFKEIEVYDQGRYFAVTGSPWPGAPTLIEDRQEELEQLCSEFWPSESTSPKVLAIRPGFPKSDDELIAAASAASNGEKFRRLFDGDTSGHGGDDSAADMALASMLAFWCGPNPERIFQIIQRSGLFREKWQRADYRELTISKAIESCREFYSPTARREIQVGSTEVQIGADEHRVIDQVVDCLETEPNLYQRGGVLVRIARDALVDDEVTRAKGSASIVLLQPPTLREWITRCSFLSRYDTKAKEWVQAHPPGWLVSGLAARGQWRDVRVLNGITDVPIVRRDGSVFQTPGYDSKTGVYFDPSTEFPLMPESPDSDDAWAAVHLLREVVVDFKFESDAHMAAWFAGVLTPFARFAYEGPAPLLLIDANVRGAGKGLLAQTVGEIVLGRALPVSTYCHDSEEMRKRITAIAIAGDQMAMFDNVDGKFGNASLDAALTTTRWRDRVLGTSDQVNLPLNVTWVATGNNVQVAADTARRVIHCRLDVLEERPEERSGFRHPNLLAWVRENRGRLVAACVTVIAAFIRAGRPDLHLTPMGSFEGWSDLVRSAVVWAGLPDPCESRKAMAEAADTAREALEMVIEAFSVYDTDNVGIVVSELLPKIYPTSGDRPMDPTSIALRAALENLVSSAPGKTPQARQVGTKLRHFRRRVVNGVYLDNQSAEKRAGGAVWRIHHRQ